MLEACQDKSNEIKAIPLLIDKIDIFGKIVTADAMPMQKDIIDKIRTMGMDFLVELKAKQPSLRSGIEVRLKLRMPLYWTRVWIWKDRDQYISYLRWAGYNS